jgi:hypothetical protein
MLTKPSTQTPDGIFFKVDALAGVGIQVVPFHGEYRWFPG